ncbi:MAG TPA: DUF3891 family protein [Solirubrobacteraceae bacterium]
MILRREGDRVLGVTQTAHSALTGRLAEAWVPRDDLPWDELCTAATVHDVGWAPWEQAPQIDPRTGLPYQFFEVPDRQYEEIWARGTDEAVTFGRLVGLLVSRHFTRLAGRREGLRALVERERERQTALAAALGLDAATLDAASDLLARWDAMSLDLCGGKEPDLGEWPFAVGRLVLRFDARELPAGPVVGREVGVAGGGSGHPHGRG